MVYRLQTSDAKRRNTKTRRLLKNFEICAVNLAFKGSCHPDEHEQIEADYKLARKKLLEHIDG